MLKRDKNSTRIITSFVTGLVFICLTDAGALFFLIDLVFGTGIFILLL